MTETRKKQPTKPLRKTSKNHVLLENVDNTLISVHVEITKLERAGMSALACNFIGQVPAVARQATRFANDVFLQFRENTRGSRG